jgi:RNA polymerase sigma-70 factor (ECF subfamily)
MVKSSPEIRDESELISAICAGERQHFYVLIKPYERAVYTTAFGVLGNSTDAEDVTQEVFLKALKGLASFRGEAKFSTWLIQIAFNEARMALRRRRQKQYESLDSGNETDEGDYFPRDFADWREIPIEALLRKELRQSLTAAVASLKRIYREVLVLRDVRQLSVRQTAELLGVSENVVKTRLLRARLQLRDALAPGYDGSWTGNSKEFEKVRPW